MKLHKNTALFKEAVVVTAQRLNLPPEYIEKDYWVTYALYSIFNNDVVKNYTVFKGGTALSKCNDIIKRFSEDIDLVITRNSDENPNQLKRKIKEITKTVSGIMPEVSMEGITLKLGMSRKTGHQ